MLDPTLPVGFQRRGGRDAGPCHCFSEQHSLDAMPTELAPTVADDSTLPLFAVPADIRQWGVRVRVADRSAVRATLMLIETAVLYAAFIVIGESIGTLVGLDIGLGRARHVHDAHRCGASRGCPSQPVRATLAERRHRRDHRRDRRVPWSDVPVLPPLAPRPHPARPRAVRPRGVLRRTVDPAVLDRSACASRARTVYVIGLFIGGVSFARATHRRRDRHLRRSTARLRRCGVARASRATLGMVPVRTVGIGHRGSACSPGTWSRSRCCGGWCRCCCSCAVRTRSSRCPSTTPRRTTIPMVTATGSVRSTPFYRWLTLDGNFHLAHHVFPTASWWRLADADAQLRNVTTLRYRGYVAFHRDVWRRPRRLVVRLTMRCRRRNEERVGAS